MAPTRWLIDASRMRIPVPFRSRPRWSRRFPTGIAPGIGHGHAWVFMKSHWQQGGYPKLAASAPDATVAGRHTEFPPDSEARVQEDAAPADSRTLPTPTSAARARSCWRGVSTGHSVRRGDLSTATCTGWQSSSPPTLCCSSRTRSSAAFPRASSRPAAACPDRPCGYAHWSTRSSGRSTPRSGCRPRAHAPPDSARSASGGSQRSPPGCCN